MAQERIQLNAVFRTDNKLYIIDQDGREFDLNPDWSLRQSPGQGLISVELEAPYWPDWTPRVNVTFNLPVQVESERIQSLINSMDRNKL